MYKYSFLIVVVFSFSLLVACDNNDEQVIVLSTEDPLLKKQWNLQAQWSEAIDIGLHPLNSTSNGKGVVIAIVDDGMDYSHEDLQSGFSEALSYNYINQTGIPNIGAHGTHNAGIIAARANNAVGIRGIAPESTLASYNLLVNPSSLNEADAMIRNMQSIDISNNSWGPVDGTGELWQSGTLWKDAISQGASNGRSGKGIIYIWGAGNGQPADNSNYDGYANNPHLIAVGSVTDKGLLTLSSEPGANIWVVAPTEGTLAGYDIVTTDIMSESGVNTGGNPSDLIDTSYTKLYRGTSAATAQVSGVVALMLSENESLSWRDVRMILARTAVKNDELDSDWINNASAYAYSVNHQYGFGLVHANNALEMARSWHGLADMQVRSYNNVTRLAVPDGLIDGVVTSISVPVSELLSIEYITVNLEMSGHKSMGDLKIELHSPAGTVSRLMSPHRCQSVTGSSLSSCQSSLDSWSFGVARLLEESSAGDWRLSVSDMVAGHAAEIISWSITVYGH